MSNAAKSCDQGIPTISLSYFDGSIKLFLDLLSNLYYLTFFIKIKNNKLSFSFGFSFYFWFIFIFSIYRT